MFALYRRRCTTSCMTGCNQPSYLHNLITVLPPRSTRSSSLVTLARPSTSSSLRIRTDRSFRHASPRLQNQLPASVRQPRTNVSNSDSPSSLSGTSSIGSIDSPLSSSITSSHVQCTPGVRVWTLGFHYLH